MTRERFEDLRDKLIQECFELSHNKGTDYSKGSKDFLNHFKEAGKGIDLDPSKACWLLMNKGYNAITQYVKSGGKSESEPFAERIKDLINYATLLYALEIEKIEGSTHLPAIPIKETFHYDI